MGKYHIITKPLETMACFASVCPDVRPHVELSGAEDEGGPDSFDSLVSFGGLMPFGKYTI